MTESAFACGMIILTPAGVTQVSGRPLLRIAYEADRTAAESICSDVDFSMLAIDLARKAAHDKAVYLEAMLYLSWQERAPSCDICDQPLRHSETSESCEHFLFRAALIAADCREAIALLCGDQGCHELALHGDYCGQHRPDPRRIVERYIRDAYRFHQ